MDSVLLQDGTLFVKVRPASVSNPSRKEGDNVRTTSLSGRGVVRKGRPASLVGVAVCYPEIEESGAYSEHTECYRFL